MRPTKHRKYAYDELRSESLRKTSKYRVIVKVETIREQYLPISPNGRGWLQKLLYRQSSTVRVRLNENEAVIFHNAGSGRPHPFALGIKRRRRYDAFGASLLPITSVTNGCQNQSALCSALFSTQIDVFSSLAFFYSMDSAFVKHWSSCSYSGLCLMGSLIHALNNIQGRHVAQARRAE
jgi:hypothetical protein